MSLHLSERFKNHTAVHVATDALKTALRDGKQKLPFNVKLDYISKGKSKDSYKTEFDNNNLSILANSGRGAAYGIAWLTDQLKCRKINVPIKSKWHNPDFPVRYAGTMAAMYDVRKPLAEYMPHGWLKQMDLPAPDYVSSDMVNAVHRFKKLCNILLMQRYNGVVIADNVHMVTLDNLFGENNNVLNDSGRIRTSKYLQHYNDMITYASALEMDIIVSSDEIMFPIEIMTWLDEECPLDPESKVWILLKEKYREMIQRFPQITGIMVRIGESHGNDFYSGLMLRTHRCDKCAHLTENHIHQMMCEAILSVIGDRKLFYRTWITGANSLHSDPEKYLQVFNSIKDNRLVPSIKNTETDFWLHNDLNKTLGIGDKEQMAEFDCHRDMDGLQTIPCVLAERYSTRLKKIYKKGVQDLWAWPCESGSPNCKIGTNGNLPEYPVTYFQGFTKWTEANVYILARIGWDRTLSPESVVTDWVSKEFGYDTASLLTKYILNSAEICEAITTVDSFRAVQGTWCPNLPLLNSMRLVRKYPYGWIVFTQDLNVYSLLLDIYRVAKQNLQQEIETPYNGVKALKKFLAQLNSKRKKFKNDQHFLDISENIGRAICTGELIASYRESFLRYYKIAEMLHGPINHSRMQEPGPFKSRNVCLEENRWNEELILARKAVNKFEKNLSLYREKYSDLDTSELDSYLEMAKGFLDVVWLD